MTNLQNLWYLMHFHCSRTHPWKDECTNNGETSDSFAEVGESLFSFYVVN